MMRNFAFYTIYSLFTIILPFDVIALATNMVVKQTINKIKLNKSINEYKIAVQKACESD
jgi:hypothetical protein